VVPEYAGSEADTAADACYCSSSRRGRLVGVVAAAARPGAATACGGRVGAACNHAYE
jgi:hypothetical protein